MVKRFLSALIALAYLNFSFAAVAQSFPKPPDVTAFSQVAPVYNTSGSANTPRDPTVTPMPIGSGLTNIPIPANTNRIQTFTDITPATFTASISGTVMTVSAFTSGKAIAVGDEIGGSGVTASTTISSLGTGTGGTGTYNLNNSMTVSSEAMTASNGNFCANTAHNGNTFCGEAKFRTQADFSHMLPDDPIRNYGQPGQSHLHCFFGGGSTNAYSTYKTLRNHGLTSYAAGSDANATGYWHPCIEVLNPYGDGKNFAMKDDFITIYYSNIPADGEGSAFIPTGLRYVFGFDMDAASPSFGTGGQYAWLQAYLDTANTTIGHTRYQLTSPSTGLMSTSPRWLCIGATAVTGADTHFEPSSSKYLAMGDGSDPFGGTCSSGAGFFLRIDGAECYDGTNLWSPGGYKHFIPAIWDNDFSSFVCPTNYYHLPKLTLEISFNQQGPSDYTRWVLSSDLSYRSAHGLTATSVPNGSTFHTDWDDGWDQVVRRIWETNCIGSQHNVSHTCNSSTISSTQLLMGAQNTSGVVRSPVVDTTALPHVNETDAGWMLIPPAWSGGMTGMHIHQ
jgi:hypothetical protein